MIKAVTFLSAVGLGSVAGCSDFMMNFTSPDIVMSGRTMDLGSTTNWTVSSWPRDASEALPDPPGGFAGARYNALYGTVGITGNWFGDEKYGFYSLFGEAINEKGMTCGQLTLVGSEYQSPSLRKTNVFFGVFCKWATQLFSNVEDVAAALEDVSIWGPEILAEHFVLRDANGVSLVIELIGGEQHTYLDYNDKSTGYGIMTNEPSFDWHLTNVEHYEWKRSLSRQAIPVPGSWYPEERFLRIHMVKSGMQDFGLFDVASYQEAFSLTAQVLNVVTVPYGNQFGTDTGENSGEGSNPDHTMWALIRDHATPALYWRDSGNPTFRGIKLSDIDFTPGAAQKHIVLETGPFFIDVTSQFQ
jgi:choloylglycine hydrolase